MREIASTYFKMFWGRTPRPPAKICPPHSQNAADALVRMDEVTARGVVIWNEWVCVCVCVCVCVLCLQFCRGDIFSKQCRSIQCSLCLTRRTEKNCKRMSSGV